jgi:hypothetical protein
MKWRLSRHAQMGLQRDQELQRQSCQEVLRDDVYLRKGEPPNEPRAGGRINFSVTDDVDTLPAPRIERAAGTEIMM